MEQITMPMMMGNSICDRSKMEGIVNQIVTVCKREMNRFEDVLGRSDWEIHHSGNNALFFLNLDLTDDEIETLGDTDIPVGTDAEDLVYESEDLHIYRWQEGDWYNIIIYQVDKEGDVVTHDDATLNRMMQSVANKLKIPIKDE
jgi:hypothetical protein